MANIMKRGNAVFNIFRWLSPLSEKASELYARHEMRQASVEVIKEMMLQDMQSLDRIREQIQEKIMDSDDELEKFRLRGDIEAVEERRRQLIIGIKSTMYLPSHIEISSDTQDTPPSISPHWQDKFNELARMRNEEWREGLLASALAREATNPGSISPRALWLIGTLEENAFHAFATYLDHAVKCRGTFWMPRLEVRFVFDESQYGGPTSMGGLYVVLDPLGLLARAPGLMTTTGFGFPNNQKTTVSYSNRVYEVIVPKEEIFLQGYCTTDLGDTIGSLYEPIERKQGLENLETLIGYLKEEGATVTLVS